MVNSKSESLTIIAVILISAVQCAPTIDSAGGAVSGFIGESVVLQCSVTGLEQTTQTVIWKFVDHNITVSADQQIHVVDGEDKYEIFRPQDQGSYWNLRISQLGAADEGTYKCYVAGLEDTVKVIYHLDILGAPTKQPATVLDVTSCCQSRNVSCSLPLCRSNSTFDELMGILSGNCIDNELYDVIVCGQGGRNHMGCCMRSNLPDTCLELCGGVYDENTMTDFTPCLLYATTIQKCFIEGTTWFPSPPVSVSASVSGTVVTVSWQPPLENADKVTGYRVNYRAMGEEHFMKTMSLDKNRPFNQLRNLKKNTQYELNVVALATSGSSQPSFSVLVFTKGDMPDTANITQTVANCCQGKGVTDQCLSYCQADVYGVNIHPDIYTQCFGDLKTIYQCLTGQGNHTPCCQRMNVPSDCTLLCEGQPPPEWNVVKCFMYLPVISSCMQENSALLPLPPVNTHIVPGSVSTDAATIQWDPPPGSDAGPSLRYIVAWQPIAAYMRPDWTTVTVYSGTSHRITGLRPALIYKVVVSTVNDNGSSLPELTLELVTEGFSNVIQKPYNETECCLGKGVSSDCIHICDHSFRMSDTTTVLLEGLKCSNDLLTMIECASDFRNHTECCMRRDVPDNCLGICALKYPYNTDDMYKFVECISYLQDVSTCLDEGKKIFPKTPEKFAIKNISPTSVTLDWQTPSGPNVTYYKVRFAEVNTRDWVERNTTETFIVLDKLKTYFGYYFEVYSVNEDGTSFPSLQKAYTQSVPGDKPIDWRLVWQNRSECCAKSGVSEACQPMCQGEEFDPDKCMTELDKIIVCASDGRDHSTCCSQVPQFPDTCLVYCKGQTPPQTAQYAYCLMFVNSMYTCFSEGRGLLPTPPQHVYVEVVSQTHVTIVWDPSAENCDRTTCSYEAWLWKSGEHNRDDSVRKMRVVPGNTRYMFTRLYPFTNYELTVIARNNKGSSLPASIVRAITKSAVMASLSVTQYPPGIIDQGNFVQLECVTTGYDTKKVQWMFNSQVITTNNLYRIAAVDEHSAGNYMCTGFFQSDEKHEKNLTLNVRYLPAAGRMVFDQVLPGTGQNGDITCSFKGFPDIVSWSKDGNSLQNTGKYIMQPLDYNLATGVTTSILRVMAVTEDDFGSYTCKAINSFGSKTISGDFKYAYPTIAPATKPPGVDPAGCCRQLGVQEKCISKICTFAIDIVDIAFDLSLVDCMLDFNKFLVCGADGRNHTSCCKKNGVEDYCLPVCAGESPDFMDSFDLLKCINHGEQIMDCVQDGHQYIPSAPQSVSVVQKYASMVVKWQAPSKNPELVNVYDVFYTKGTSTTHATVSHASSSFVIEEIQKNVDYQIWVIAVNDFGQSIKSNIISLSVTKVVPSAPLNPQARLVDINNIRVTWQAPRTGIPPLGYSVYFGPQSSAKPTITGKIRATETRLDGLVYETTYVIYVKAFNMDGEGEPTEQMLVETGKNPNPGGQSPQTGGQDTGNKTGMAVGIVLGILLLLAIAIVAYLMFRRYRSTQHQPRETVAFENPQYGPRVTGLPGEGTNESNQFQYGHLHEETEADNGYSTVTHPDTPATMKLDQQT